MWENLRDYFHSLFPEIANADLYFSELSELEKTELFGQLEAVKIEVDKTLYIEKRKQEYPSTEELIVAMWEGDQATIDSIEATRQAIKIKYPKS